MIKPINQVFVFMLEVAMLLSYGYFGLARPWNLATRLSFTILIIALAILLWARFAAPKSTHRLHMPSLAIFRTLMFSFPALLLLLSGNKNLAIVIFALTLITQTISCFTEQ